MIISQPELPERKLNSPLGYWACWNCKAKQTLIKIRDNQGKKTEYFTCENCKHLGMPSDDKSSFMEFKYKI